MTMFSWLCRVSPPETDLPDPVVEKAEAEKERLERLRQSVAAAAPEREAQRELARIQRAQAEKLLAANHFGESLEKAWRSRK